MYIYLCSLINGINCDINKLMEIIIGEMCFQYIYIFIHLSNICSFLGKRTIGEVQNNYLSTENIDTVMKFTARNYQPTITEAAVNNAAEATAADIAAGNTAVNNAAEATAADIAAEDTAVNNAAEATAADIAAEDTAVNNAAEDTAVKTFGWNKGNQ